MRIAFVVCVYLGVCAVVFILPTTRFSQVVGAHGWLLCACWRYMHYRDSKPNHEMAEALRSLEECTRMVPDSGIHGDNRIPAARTLARAALEKAGAK